MLETQVNRLKACPFCPRRSSRDIEISYWRTHAYVYCGECLAQGPTVQYRDDAYVQAATDKAIVLWNKRYKCRKGPYPVYSGIRPCPFCAGIPKGSLRETHFTCKCGAATRAATRAGMDSVQGPGLWNQRGCWRSR